MKEVNEINEWRYEIKVVKRRGQNEHLNKVTNKNKFTYYNNKTYIDS